MKLTRFNKEELETANRAFEVAEDLVSDYYKISSNVLVNSGYDIRTLSELDPREIVFGPAAQVMRYKRYTSNSFLRSQSYDLYRVCIQDHTAISILESNPDMKLFYFLLYVTTHELVHVFRFMKFSQNFTASLNEVLREETRVHEETHNILFRVDDVNIKSVFNFYDGWFTHNGG